MHRYYYSKKSSKRYLFYLIGIFILLNILSVFNKSLFDLVNFSRYEDPSRFTEKTKKAVTSWKNYSMGFYHSSTGMFNYFSALPASKQSNIPSFEIIIDETKMNRLNADLPLSGKVYQSAQLTIDGERYDVNVRYRGDNIYHWGGDFKSWRVKFQKNDRMYGFRYLNLINPRSLTGLEMLAGFYLGEEMNLITPPYSYARLFVNGQYYGVVQAVMQPSEAVMRANKQMPGDLYSIEPSQGDWVNASAWTKKASSNFFPADNRDAFQRFLNVLQKLNRSDYDETSLEELKKVANIDKILKRWAVQNIAGSMHQDEKHNQLWYVDPLTQKAEPIVWDVWGHGQYEDNPSIMRPTITPHLALIRYGPIISQKNKILYEFLLKDIQTDAQERYLKELWNVVKPDFASSPILDKGMMSRRPWRPHNIPRTKLKKMSKKVFEFIKPRNEKALKIASYNKVDFVKTTEVEYSIGLKGYVGSEWQGIYLEKNNNLPETIKIAFDNGQNISFKKVKKTNRYVPISQVIIHPSLALTKNIRWHSHYQPMPIVTRIKFKISGSYKIKGVSLRNIASGTVQDIPITRKTDSSMKNAQMTFLNDITQMEKGKVYRWTYEATLLEIKPKDKLIVYKAGEHILTRNRIFKENETVKFNSGAHIKLGKNVSLIFKGKVICEGTEKEPVIMKSRFDDPEPQDQWQAIALIGEQTSGSTFTNCHISGGKGGVVDGVYYTGATNILHTKDVNISQSVFSSNVLPSDDTLHIAKSSNIVLEKVSFIDGNGDGLDVDISSVNIAYSLFKDNNNDGLDLMESKATVVTNQFIGSGDKGISTGENSELLAHNNYFEKNNVGVAVKDRSVAQISASMFKDSITDISAYKKSSYYSSGGVVKLLDDNTFIRNGKKVDSKINIDRYSCLNDECVKRRYNVRTSVTRVLNQRYAEMNSKEK